MSHVRTSKNYSGLPTTVHLLDRSTWFEAPKRQQLQTNSKRYADWIHNNQAEGPVKPR
jgi:hypothetical protein